MATQKTVLITGGAGFIGSALVRHIFDNYPSYRIVVLDALTYAGNPQNWPSSLFSSERFTFWHGDVQNASLADMAVAGSDIVVHLAAETHVSRSIFDDSTFFKTDVLGTQAIANAVMKNRDKVERFIHVSTSEVYGTAETPLMDENHPLNPRTPYAAAKCGADRLVYSYCKTYDFPGVILRPFNNYGPRQHLEKVIPRFISSALRGEKLTVHGDGSAVRDWIHVEDTARAIDRVMHAKAEEVNGETFNIASGTPLSVRDIATKILEITKADPDLVTYCLDRPGQVQNHIADMNKAKTVLDFQASIGFESGIEKTVSWYRDNQAWCEPMMWMREVKLTLPSGKSTAY